MNAYVNEANIDFMKKVSLFKKGSGKMIANHTKDGLFFIFKSGRDYHMEFDSEIERDTAYAEIEQSIKARGSS